MAWHEQAADIFGSVETTRDAAQIAAQKFAVLERKAASTADIATRAPNMNWPPALAAGARAFADKTSCTPQQNVVACIVALRELARKTQILSTANSRRHG